MKRHISLFFEAHGKLYEGCNASRDGNAELTIATSPLSLLEWLREIAIKESRSDFAHLTALRNIYLTVTHYKSSGTTISRGRFIPDFELS